ncbi:hypothetical protein ACFYWO_33510 [Streptomyces sp. NPDC002932]|uniref:hypothetical protein n=1 Tax=Streptomyces sp. NPDC002932 TaxID=3364672 RepID=UPI003691DA09
MVITYCDRARLPLRLDPVIEKGHVVVTAADGRTALIIGASRGLGYVLAAEYLATGDRDGAGHRADRSA